MFLGTEMSERLRKFLTKGLKHRLKRRLRIMLDFFQGYDFLTVKSPEKLGLGTEDYNTGSPSGGDRLEKVVRSLSITHKDRILDIGCAKGSALRTFSKFPFGAIGGLEVSEELFTICENNLKILSDHRIKIECQNAEYFTNYGNYNYFYLYNPFRKLSILKSVMNRINVQCTGKIWIIYNNPFGCDVLVKDGFVVSSRYVNEWGREILVFSKDL